jgi:ADP-heptose:LPS heptosyltransferase
MLNNTTNDSTLASIAQKGLSELLDQANSRIQQLEAAETRLSRQVQDLERRLNAYTENTKNALSDTRYQDWFVASRATKAITSLNAMQRRDIWLNLCLQTQTNQKIQNLAPHDNIDPKIRILVIATGGYGDMLYGTTVVRELYKHFNAPLICAIAENLACEEVYKRNPYVYSSCALHPAGFRDFTETALCLDVFDLIVEIRYAVSYARPPLSRVPYNFIANSNEVASKWQKYIREGAWPFRNNQLAKVAKEQGLHQLDLVGITSGLPINKNSSLDFIFQSEFYDPAIVQKKYVTVHHGSDKNMIGANGLQTKNLYPEQWSRIVEIAQSAGYITVQLGTSNEEQIHRVDVDLRGKLSLEDTAYVISMADLHIDTEGGLVHLAKSVNTRALVFFGPTPVNFFGYPSNINIAPKICGDCWWMTKTWAQRCPLGETETPCMASHNEETFANNIQNFSCSTYQINLVQRSNLDRKEISKRIAKHITSEKRVLVHIDDFNAKNSFNEIFDNQLCWNENFTFSALNIQDTAFALSCSSAKIHAANSFQLYVDRYIEVALAFIKYPSSNAELHALSNLIYQLCKATKFNGSVYVYLECTDQPADLVEKKLTQPIGKRYSLTGDLIPKLSEKNKFTELSIESVIEDTMQNTNTIWRKLEEKFRR